MEYTFWNVKYDDGHCEEYATSELELLLEKVAPSNLLNGKEGNAYVGIKFSIDQEDKEPIEGIVMGHCKVAVPYTLFRVEYENGIHEEISRYGLEDILIQQ